MKKRLCSLLLALVMVLGLATAGLPTAEAATTYDSAKALAYAKAHWNDGKGLCAEFVSDCLKAGGLSSWNRECTNLYNQLNKEVVNGAKIASVQYLKASGNYIKCADNVGKIARGDVLFWLCQGCPYDSVGGPYQHTAFVSDVSGTYVQVYQHNAAQNNTAAWVGSCYECGRNYSHMVVIHFNIGPYLNRCTGYYSHCEIQTAEQKTLKSLPCSADTCSESKTLATIGNGATLEAISIWKNTAGNCWYKVKYNGQTGYIYAGNTKFIRQLTSDVTISGERSPSALNVGQFFTIEGTVKGTYSYIKSLGGYIFRDGVAQEAKNAIYSKSVEVSNNNYSLKDSTVDYALLFNKLSTGVYWYLIQVGVISCYSTDGKTLLSVTAYRNLVDKRFTVGNPHTTHTGGTATCCSKAVCTVCGAAYGSYNTSNHTGGTEVRNARAATCTSAGYTGDTVCKGCGAIIRTGTSTAALGHTGGTATCQALAVCTRCGQSYGQRNTSNHTGGTEVHNARTATCTAAGYTGDTMCRGCGVTLSSGSSTAALGHNYVNSRCNRCGRQTTVDDLQSAHPYANNADQRWSYTHSGAQKLYITFSYDTELERGYDYLYIEDSADSRVGSYTGTELTGKTVVVPGDTVKLHLTSDRSVTAYGFRVTRVDVTAPVHTHTGGTATCCRRAVCTFCDEAYGSYSSTNHTGGTEVRNKKTATYTAAGYTGDTVCKGCGTVLEKGKTIARKTLTAPKSVRVTPASATSVKVTWKKVAGAKSYEIYRVSGKGAATRVATVSGTSTTSATVKKLKSGTTYTFKVRACVNSTRSSFSSAAKGSTKPATPTSLKATAAKTTVKLTWSKATGAQEYQVFRVNSDGSSVYITTIRGTSSTIKNLKSGKTYTYKVRAVRTVNGTAVYGAFSSQVKTTTKK